MCFSTSQPRSLRWSLIPGFRPRPQEGQFLCQPQLHLDLVPFSISRHLIRAISKNILSSQFSSNVQCGGLRLLIQSRFPSQKLVRRFPNGRHRSPPGQAGLHHRSACTHAISLLRTNILRAPSFRICTTRRLLPAQTHRVSSRASTENPYASEERANADPPRVRKLHQNKELLRLMESAISSADANLIFRRSL
jgi:hypothetical protein